jgi:hypothetical protein
MHEDSPIIMQVVGTIFILAADVAGTFARFGPERMITLRTAVAARVRSSLWRGPFRSGSAFFLHDGAESTATGLEARLRNMGASLALMAGAVILIIMLDAFAA